MNDNNFVVIPGWARTKLALKGNDLLIFSIIYGFSQSEDVYFVGGIKYLMEWTGATKKTVIESLKSLREKEYIIREDYSEGFIKDFRYYSNPKFREEEITPSWCKNYTIEGVKNSEDECKNYTTPGVKISQSGCKNYTDTYKENRNKLYINNKEINICLSESDLFEKCWEIYPRKEGKKKAFECFKRAIKSGQQIENIIKGIEMYVRYIQLNGIDIKYVKMGSTYFQNECWNDEVIINNVQSGFGNSISTVQGNGVDTF